MRATRLCTSGPQASLQSNLQSVPRRPSTPCGTPSPRSLHNPPMHWWHKLLCRLPPWFPAPWILDPHYKQTATRRPTLHIVRDAREHPSSNPPSLARIYSLVGRSKVTSRVTSRGRRPIAEG